VIGVGQTMPLYIIQVFSGADCAWSYASTLADAAENCQAQGASVISMSLGCSAAVEIKCKSSVEQNVFDNLYAAGVLSIAAAGNGGNSWNSYPASYDSVVSIAATDEADLVASFSQTNAQVELAAPGVSVDSTVPMGHGVQDTLFINNQPAPASAMGGSGLGTISAELCDCGDGTAPCTGVAGKICFIQRGTNSFVEKADNCNAGGGIGALIYNNVDGSFLGDCTGLANPAMLVYSMSKADGDYVKTKVDMYPCQIITDMSSEKSNYAFYDGTSMATPHVSAVAAKVWSNSPTSTNDQIRTALQQAARIPGQPAGTRTTSYGYGIINAPNTLALL
jgi:subtilisin family serine protease